MIPEVHFIHTIGRSLKFLFNDSNFFLFLWFLTCSKIDDAPDANKMKRNFFYSVEWEIVVCVCVLQFWIQWNLLRFFSCLRFLLRPGENVKKVFRNLTYYFVLRSTLCWYTVWNCTLSKSGCRFCATGFEK